MGILDRWIRASVERAVRLQPRRVRKVADEYLFSAPGAREEVEEIRDACRRLVDAGLTSSSLGRVAVKRKGNAVTQAAPGTDLRAVDARHLATAERSEDDPVVEAAAACGAAVLAHPQSLLALAVAGRTPSPTPQALADQAGPIEIVDVPPSGTPGVWLVTDLGAIAVAADLGDAVTRLEAAERLAAITTAGLE